MGHQYQQKPCKIVTQNSGKEQYVQYLVQYVGKNSRNNQLPKLSQKFGFAYKKASITGIYIVHAVVFIYLYNFANEETLHGHI